MSYASKRRQSSGDDEGGGANWMDTYGDLVTLLLCFFVLLFAFSSIDSAKWASLAAAFGGSPMMIASTSIDMTATIVNPVEGIPRSNDSSSGTSGAPEIPDEFNDVGEVFFELHARLEAFISEHGLAASLESDFEAFMLIMRFDENIFFNSGEAELLPESLSILDKMALFFEENSDLYQMIRIEGHTDNMPISTSRYPSNWQLSGDRSMNALYYIVNSGKVNGEKIMQSGYGEQHPIASNDTAEGRALNRRVDFVIEGIKAG